MTKDEIQAQIDEINRQLDPLEQWKQGYREGLKASVASINEATGQKFTDLVDVILYLRKLS